jgi:hypothetical protein
LKKNPENHVVFGALETGTCCRCGQFEAWRQANRPGTGETFFHPDFTVGPGVSPDHALLPALAGFTAGRELAQSAPHPAPKVASRMGLRLLFDLFQL